MPEISPFIIPKYPFRLSVARYQRRIADFFTSPSSHAPVKMQMCRKFCSRGWLIKFALNI